MLGNFHMRIDFFESLFYLQKGQCHYELPSSNSSFWKRSKHSVRVQLDF